MILEHPITANALSRVSLKASNKKNKLHDKHLDVLEEHLGQQQYRKLMLQSLDPQRLQVMGVMNPSTFLKPQLRQVAPVVAAVVQEDREQEMFQGSRD